jgi:hypothetical protein
MPSFCHIRKHGEWTSEEKEICLKALKEAETRLNKRRVDEGLILENVVVPLPDKKHLCKYRKDLKLKKQMEPYQTINLFNLKGYEEYL